MTKVDVLLLLMNGPGACDARGLGKRLRGLRGVADVRRVRAGNGRLMNVEYDPARVSARQLHVACEDSGCLARLIGL